MNFKKRNRPTLAKTVLPGKRCDEKNSHCKEKFIIDSLKTIYLSFFEILRNIFLKHELALVQFNQFVTQKRKFSVT